MEFTERVSHLAPEGAYQMLVRANEMEAEGHEIIHMEIGQPNFPTFENIVKAGTNALEEGHTRYSPSGGLSSLRQASAEHASKFR